MALRAFELKEENLFSSSDENEQDLEVVREVRLQITLVQIDSLSLNWMVTTIKLQSKIKQIKC